MSSLRGGTDPIATTGLLAFADESSCLRSDTTQEYLIGAVIVDESDCEAMRDALRPLRLPGQIKPHWTDEGPRRKQKITETIADLGSMHAVVAHLSERRRRQERFRRKCLETLYFELCEMRVLAITFESRSSRQDEADRAHVVSLQNQGLYQGLRIGHCKGGDDPLLWITDAVLGAVNASRAGETQYLDCLRESLLIDSRTPDSLDPLATK